jgi:hypothetical protein
MANAGQPSTAAALDNAMLRATGLFLILAQLVTTACGGGSPLPSSPTERSGYAGEWSGTTLQGDGMTFTVSPEQKVTAITITYRLNGCSGTRTVSGLSLDIARPTRPSGNPSAGPFDNPGFGYASGETIEQNFFSMVGAFTSNEIATGLTTFSNFMGCGNGATVWNARRR